MSNFFSDHPIIGYDIDHNGSSVRAVNILKRFKPIDTLLDRSVLYYTYDVQDGERPDVVAFKFYGRVDYDWVVLMFNQMADRFFDWPMSYHEFTTYIEQKYGSSRIAMQTVHHYERILQQKETLVDGTFVQERVVNVDQAAYLLLDDNERRVVYQWDHEMALNEKRRTIRILDESYIPQLLSEKKTIFGG
jgi:hypothetical protein